MRTLFLTAAALAALNGVAVAQAEDEIVVTATRTPTAIARVPAQVDVIDVESVRARGVASVADALAETPGLAVVQTGGFGQQTSIFTSGANSNHTLVLFDGLRLNDPSSPNSAFDAGQDTLAGLSRIEIVQGPMSAVHGSDAIGGVINLLPRHGRDGALNAELSIAAGSFGTVTGGAGADGTLGRFRYALSAEGYATDGHDIVPERFATHTGEEDGASSTSLTGVFDFEVNDAFALDLLIRARRASAEFDAFDYPPPFFSETRIEDADLELSKNDLTLARVGATWRVSDALSVRLTGGGIEEQREQSDNGGISSRYEGERRFADLTLDWQAGDMGALRNVGLVAGLIAENEEVDLNTGFSAVADEQERTGAFVTAQGDLASLTFTAAARLDDADGFGTHSTWRAGASYAVTNALRVYTAYGTSFRAPTLSERYTPFYGNPDLDPEEASAWEVGANARFGAFGREDGLEFRAVYRDLDVDNLITGAPPTFVNANIAKADIQSAELRAEARPLSWLTARVSYVHTDAENGETGEPLQRRPENAWSTALLVQHGPFSGELAWKQIGERYDRLYGDDAVFSGLGYLPSYDVVRASAAWALSDAVQVYVAGANVLDETYETTGAFAGPPANVMVGLRLRP